MIRGMAASGSVEKEKAKQWYARVAVLAPGGARAIKSGGASGTAVRAWCREAAAQAQYFSMRRARQRAAPQCKRRQCARVRDARGTPKA